MNYTDNDRVTDIRFTSRPWKGRTVSGYGGAIPTQTEIRYRGDNGRYYWHRVRVMQYGNSGSAYITVGGVILFLDTDTEHDVMQTMEEGER